MQVIADVSAIAGDTHDFAQQALHPAWSPQKLTLTAATALAVVMTDEDGKAHTITVPAAGVVVITRPIRILTKAGSGAVQVIAEWLDPNGSNQWNS